MSPKQTLVAMLGLALIAFNLFSRPRSGAPSRYQVLSAAYLPTNNNPTTPAGPQVFQGAGGQLGGL